MKHYENTDNRKAYKFKPILKSYLPYKIRYIDIRRYMYLVYVCMGPRRWEAWAPA